MSFDPSQIDPSSLSKESVRRLVESMYTMMGGNDRIKEIFLSADRPLVLTGLDSLVQDRNPEVRCNAVEMLVYLEGARAIQWVDKLLDDPDENARCAGCILLSCLDSPLAVSRLRTLLQNDPSGDVRYRAVEGLEAIGDKASIPSLQRAAKHDSGTNFEGRRIRDLASEAIKTIMRRE